MGEGVPGLPRATDGDRADEIVSDLLEAEAGAEGHALAAALGAGPQRSEFLAAVLDGSSHFHAVARRHPDMIARCLTDDPEQALDALCEGFTAEMAACSDQKEVTRRVRLFRTEATTLTAFADLAGRWDVVAMTAAMTRIADLSVQAVVDFLLRDAARRGRFEPLDPASPGAGSGLIVLAMGKYGAGELNFSSDVDLIIFYDPDAGRCPPGEAGSLFVRLARDLVKILQERTGDGYAFRVDLRLRPDPGATAVAISIAAAFQYYESLGQNWERAAFIKARPCAGDIEAGWSFLAEIAPFVWRKYMDYAALADVHAMKRQIHAHKGHGTVAVAGHNIKLGRGGIREIEFFAQTQQLIAGGRNPELRTPRTLEALDQLRIHGWVREEDAETLAGSYCFLRKIEHRLQMQADEQTHTVPDAAAKLEAFARFAGFADAQAFSEALAGQLVAVQSCYAGLFEDAPELSADTGNLRFAGDDDDPGTLETLARMGFSHPHAVIQTVKAWHFSRYAATRSTRARERLTEITPALLEALASTANPDAALAAFDRFLTSLPAGVQLFSLLRSNPQLLSLLGDILGTAPNLAAVLSRRPRVFAALIEPEFYGDLPAPRVLTRRLEQTFADATGFEDCLDRARIFGQEQRFLIGARVLSGTVSAGEAGAAYAGLADTMVRRLHRLCRDELAERHGLPASGRSAVIAMGKLGGREMTAGSDIDLILLYQFDEDEHQTPGPKPLSSPQFFIRLTQRLIAALSAPTAEGTLYETDLRLRPSGRSGPLATRLSSFVSYQASEAWTWEHMALTRARVISGQPEFREAISEAVREILVAPRDSAKIAADITEMRERVQKEKASANPWDIKSVPGGLVDVEFIAQYLQLAHASENPDILDQNTLQCLRKAGELGVLKPEESDRLIGACGLYHSITQVLRLCVGGEFDPAAAPGGLVDLLKQVSDMPDLSRVELSLKEAQSEINSLFAKIVAA